jgi:peptidoglycan/xylan/chitin deacetylase (PgdA/CDA1 family)
MSGSVPFAYAAIVDRPPLSLPDRARVAVWVVVNVELWDLGHPLPRTLLPAPGGGSYVPDIANYGWYDYGLRVGFWRLREVLDRHGVRATLSVNGAVCKAYPRLVEAALQSRWEFLAHGLIQRPLHQEERERQVIHQTAEIIQEVTGTRPRGWLSPGLAETWDTLGYLADEGFDYVADWCNDDQPYEIPTKPRPLVSVPYSLEINDIPMFLVQHHAAEELLRRSCDQFDTYYHEGERSARIMAIAVHPYITGVPHRIVYLDRALTYLRRHQGVLFWTGSQIVDWFNAYRGAAGVL